MLAAFVAGLVVPCAVAGSGLLGPRRAPPLQVGVGAQTAVASLTLGALALTGGSDLVPPLVDGGR